MDSNAKSILNDVLGPVMRGPSSSHTAGAYRMERADHPNAVWIGMTGHDGTMVCSVAREESPRPRRRLVED